MDGRAGVLKSEIKLDMARGDDVEKKKEELAEVQQKAVAAESAHMNTLADANKEFEKTAKAEQQTEKTDDEAEKTGKKNRVSDKEESKGTTVGTENISETIENNATIETDNSTDIVKVVGTTISETTTYNHVDVYL